MVAFDSLLQALYTIQCAADPTNPANSAQERLAEIFIEASYQLEQSGWQPDDH